MHTIHYTSFDAFRVDFDENFSVAEL
jgi:hypothetical protein